MLRIEIQPAPHAVTLRCSGKIVLGIEAEMLRCMAISRTERCVMLDLRNVTGMDAAGLGLLVELQGWAHERRRELKVMNPSACVRKLIRLTWLHLVLAVAFSPDIGIEFEAKSNLTPRSMTA